MAEETKHESVASEASEASEAPAAGTSTRALIREAIEQTRDLVRLEVALARDELKTELAQAKVGGFALSGAAAAGISAFTMFMVAIALAFRVSWLAALILGGILLCLAGALAVGGWKSVPTKPLAETRERVESDLKQLKERIA